MEWYISIAGRSCEHSSPSLPQLFDFVNARARAGHGFIIWKIVCDQSLEPNFPQLFSPRAIIFIESGYFRARHWFWGQIYSLVIIRSISLCVFVSRTRRVIRKCGKIEFNFKRSHESRAKRMHRMHIQSLCAPLIYDSMSSTIDRGWDEKWHLRRAILIFDFCISRLMQNYN